MKIWLRAAFGVAATDPSGYTQPWTIAFLIRNETAPGYELIESARWDGEPAGKVKKT